MALYLHIDINQLKKHFLTLLNNSLFAVTFALGVVLMCTDYASKSGVICHTRGYILWILSTSRSFVCNYLRFSSISYKFRFRGKCEVFWLRCEGNDFGFCGKSYNFGFGLEDFLFGVRGAERVLDWTFQLSAKSETRRTRSLIGLLSEFAWRVLVELPTTELVFGCETLYAAVELSTFDAWVNLTGVTILCDLRSSSKLCIPSATFRKP